MIKKYLFSALVCLSAMAGKAQTINPALPGESLGQPQPFLFTINTLNPSARGWSLNYSGGYGQRTVTPLGFDGVDQNIAVKGYLGAKFTLVASMGVVFATKGNVISLEQAEILRGGGGGGGPGGRRGGAGRGGGRGGN